MRHVQFVFLTVSLVLLAALSNATGDDKAAAVPDPSNVQEPLAVIADCLEAAEAGDFGRYVDHLSAAEQKMQAGYILFMTRNTSHYYDIGNVIADPEKFLAARTMRDLIKKHLIKNLTLVGSEGNANHASAEAVLTQLVGEANSLNSRSVHASLSGRKKCIETVGILKDPRQFLIESLAELARPTEISGAEVRQKSSSFDLDQLVKHAKTIKWTLYTRGDYAFAIEPPPEPQPVGSPYGSPYQAGGHKTQTQVEFTKIDGQWKITRFLPAGSFPSQNGLATFFRAN